MRTTRRISISIEVRSGERRATLSPIRKEDRVQHPTLLYFLRHHFRYFRFQTKINGHVAQHPRCPITLHYLAIILRDLLFFSRLLDSYWHVDYRYCHRRKPEAFLRTRNWWRSFVLCSLPATPHGFVFHLCWFLHSKVLKFYKSPPTTERKKKTADFIFNTSTPPRISSPVYNNAASTSPTDAGTEDRLINTTGSSIFAYRNRQTFWDFVEKYKAVRWRVCVCVCVLCVCPNL